MTAANIDPRYAVDETERVNNTEPSEEDIRCQLEHCTFCDYRVCCGIVNNPSNDVTSLEWNLKVTENPAYGLSVKNWLEIAEDEEENSDSKLLSKVPIATHSKNNDSSSEKKSESTIISTSQQSDCDANPEVMNQFNIPNRNVELNLLSSEPAKEKPSTDNQKVHELKHSGVSWSVLKHRQTYTDAVQKCDKAMPNEVDSMAAKNTISNPYLDEGESLANGKYKLNREKTFPVSIVKPIAKMGDKRTDHLTHACHTMKVDIPRQKPLERSRDRSKNHALIDDRTERLKKINDPLSEISQIKTEESIQEWLARINVSGNNSTLEESSKEKNLRGSAWDLRSDEAKELKIKQSNYENSDEEVEEARKVTKRERESQTDVQNKEKQHEFEVLQEHINDASAVLCNASKIAPANIPMVVMQCSRLHSHIGNKPPYQQNSLPMGTLVTALYQESEWLYVQTPHGVEGFLIAANCAPIGTMNDPAPISRRPWELCDFPIRISRHKKEEFVRQQAAYIQTKLPMNGNKQAISYVSTVKMKTNFYTDRYFSNTFKSKDSIKIAKTVTDILRSSPETKISH